MKKKQASKPAEKISNEIKRPLKVKNLQDAMGLADNKKLYSHCLVGFFFFTKLETNIYNRQPFEMSRPMQV